MKSAIKLDEWVGLDSESNFTAKMTVQAKSLLDRLEIEDASDTLSFEVEQETQF